MPPGLIRKPLARNHGCTDEYCSDRYCFPGGRDVIVRFTEAQFGALEKLADVHNVYDEGDTRYDVQEAMKNARSVPRKKS